MKFPDIKLHTVKSAVQHLSFAVLMYGGRVGIKLGPAIPCFACPFVTGCGGQCYLMGLQGFIGFGMSFAALGGPLLLRALGYLAVFVLLTALLGKVWCGWVCPLGLVQDYLALARRKLGLRERFVTLKTRNALAPVKYILLLFMAALPPLVNAGILRDEFYLPFCNICPGKALLPLLAGNPRYLALNFANTTALVLSAILIVVTGLTLVGAFFRQRIFCIFCPMLALINLVKPLTMLRLVKEPALCVGCASCRRACPMDIEAVYRERGAVSRGKAPPGAADVQTPACVDCFRCAESCPQDGALSVRFLGRRLFASSREGAARAFVKGGKR